jgi:lipopolysaccharide exporter
MGAGWIIGWRAVSRNIGLVSTLILVRLLQPSDFGLIALASGFITSIDALSAIGVQDALVRSPAVDRQLYNVGFTISVLRGALTALIIAGIAWPTGLFFGDLRLTMVMIVLAAGTLISAFENIGIVDFRRDLTFRKEFDMQVWSRIFGAITTVAAAAIWQSYWALIAGIAVSRVLRLIQSYTLSAYRPSFGLSGWRRIIGFSLWTWAQSLLYQARDRSDSIVIGRYLGTDQIGVFSVGSELGLLPATEVAEPLGRALFSGFAALQGSSLGIANMFLGAVSLGMTLVIPASLGISMIADPLVRFALGEKWTAAIPIVQILAVCGTTSVIGQTCANLLNATGRPNATFYVIVVTTAVKVIALLAFVPSMGLRGAAAAILFASVMDTVLLLGVTLPHITVSLPTLARKLARPVLATGVMTLVLWQLGMAWTPSTGSTGFEYGADACLRSAIGALCYSIALAGAWFTAGRPDGAEQFALSLVIGMWNRLRQRTLETSRP